MLNNLQKLEQRILRDFDIEYKRYIFDEIDFNSQMIGIAGSRGVGKTTFLLQYIKELKKTLPSYKSLYFSYDFPANVDIKLYQLAEEFSKIGGEYLIIDEIHRYKNFSLDLKAIYDFYPKLKVVFSGSSAVSIYNSQADLSRRVVLYYMQGLSYREFLELKLDTALPKFTLEEILQNSVDIVNALEYKFVPLEYFHEYLTYGYYPFYFKEKSQYLKLLNNVINQIIDIDFVELGLIKPSFSNKLKKLLIVVSESEPFELNITKIASNLEVSRNTVYAYLNHLKNGGLVNIVANNKNGISKLSKPEKLYLNNTNLFYALSTEPKTGTIRESFFVSQLQNSHTITASERGDFIIDKRYTIEIGGKSKDFSQIKDMKDSYLSIDTDSTQNPYKIPLWLFGFLY